MDGLVFAKPSGEVVKTHVDAYGPMLGEGPEFVPDARPGAAEIVEAIGDNLEKVAGWAIDLSSQAIDGGGPRVARADVEVGVEDAQGRHAFEFIVDH